MKKLIFAVLLWMLSIGNVWGASVVINNVHSEIYTHVIEDGHFPLQPSMEQNDTVSNPWTDSVSTSWTGSSSGNMTASASQALSFPVLSENEVEIAALLDSSISSSGDITGLQAQAYSMIQIDFSVIGGSIDYAIDITSSGFFESYFSDGVIMNLPEYGSLCVGDYSFFYSVYNSMDGSSYADINFNATSAVPVPSSFLLLGSGIIGIFGIIRKRV